MDKYSFTSLAKIDDIVCTSLQNFSLRCFGIHIQCEKFRLNICFVIRLDEPEVYHKCKFTHFISFTGMDWLGQTSIL